MPLRQFQKSYQLHSNYNTHNVYIKHNYVSYISDNSHHLCHQDTNIGEFLNLLSIIILQNNIFYIIQKWLFISC